MHRAQRRKPFIAHDEMWSVLQQRPPPVEEIVLPPRPLFDAGTPVSTQAADLQARRRQVLERDAGRQRDARGKQLAVAVQARRLAAAARASGCTDSSGGCGGREGGGEGAEEDDH